MFAKFSFSNGVVSLKVWPDHTMLVAYVKELIKTSTFWFQAFLPMRFLKFESACFVVTKMFVFFLPKRSQNNWQDEKRSQGPDNHPEIFFSATQKKISSKCW